MTDIAARVRRYVDRHQLWMGQARVLAAVSGGADSTALFLILAALRDAGAIVLAGAAHLNHQLRDDADRDEAFCAELASRLAVPFVAGRADVSRLSLEWRCSVEVAARRARYSFLEEARLACGAERVAVAHTRDDQAETVLMRLIRGAGTRGLRGILPVRGPVVRPVLDCTRAELRAFLDARGERWVEDDTNADTAHPRNRIRHELLPLLTARYRPSVAQVLARTADIAAHDDAFLEQMAEQALANVGRAEGGGWRLDAAGVRALPVALQRRVARRALVAAGAIREPGHAAIGRVLDVCRAPGRAAAQAAGLRVERFGADAVLLIREQGQPAAASWPDVVLEVPGGVDWPAGLGGCRIDALGPIKAEDRGGPGRAGVALAAAALVMPLTVRSRRPGDRIRPVGLDGTKTLQDLMVDRKVPQAERHRIPLVVDASGHIVWVVGLAVAAHAAAGPRDDVVVLTFEQPASSGSEAS